MRVLVAEEDRQVSRFIEEGLNEAGHVVDVTRDGDGATMSAQVARYDIILLGIALPRKNGFQVARALRRDGQTVPILMLTSRHSAEDVIRGLDSGANDYLPMPFRLDQLLARIRLLVCLGAAVSQEEHVGGRRMVTVAQTRFGSTGLPGKVPLPLGRATVLEVLEQQVRQAQFIGSCRR